jgi:hypothetical protein
MHRFRLRQTMLTLALAGLATATGITAPAAATAPAPEPARLVVLELFTSQGCSSCPPADALLREMAQTRADILPLAFHVTYWNYLGWRDPFSFDGATQRQNLYAQRLGASSVYTPQLVVDGQTDVVGSDRSGVASALRHATASATSVATVSLRRQGDTVSLDIGSGVGAGTIYLVGYDSEHRTPIGRGENGGRTLIEANIVRGLRSVGNWAGAPLSLREGRPEGEHVAVFIQGADGRILGAAKEVDHSS